MIELTLSQRKSILLEILNIFHLFCTQNNLDYFLFYGSLLGAVRHKGFIPWDDDIDIVMPFSDYNRFLDMWKDNSIEGIKLGHHSSRDFKHYGWSFSKLVKKNTILKRTDVSNKYESIGISIDIFPLYPALRNNHRDLSNKLNKLEQRLELKRYTIKKHFNVIIDKLKQKEIITAIKQILLSLYIQVVREKHYHQIEKCLLDEIELNQDFLFYFTPSQSNVLFSKSYFAFTTAVEFENNTYKTVVDAKNILAFYYGDYNKLPPIEKQKGHSVRAYLKVE